MFILYGNDVKHMVSVAYLSLSKSILLIVILDNGIRFLDKAAVKEMKQ